jgi:hypothetical protein
MSSAAFNSLTSGPFVSNETFNNQIVNGSPLFAFPEPFLAVGSLGSQDINALGVNAFNPYTMQWNASVEQELLGMGMRVSYLGTRSVNLLYRRNLNQPVASTVPFNNDRRPYPQFRNINFIENGGNSMYHALQVEAERKFSRGLYYQVGWTWAKQLAHGVDSGELGATIQDAYNRSADWGDELYLMRHRLVSSFIWETPVRAGPRIRHKSERDQQVAPWRVADFRDRAAADRSAFHAYIHGSRPVEHAECRRAAGPDRQRKSAGSRAIVGSMVRGIGVRRSSRERRAFRQFGDRHPRRSRDLQRESWTIQKSAFWRTYARGAFDLGDECSESSELPKS